VARPADDDPLGFADFAAGYRLGYESGYDVGFGAAEEEMAEAWTAEVHRIRALAEPDDYMARVRAAETYVRALADRQWNRWQAWESASQHSVREEARRNGIVPIPARDLARALGARPRPSGGSR
jgi:hypothetical protein